jgi:hypothetical protein
MMGRLAASLDEPVTKTTGGLIVLPADHSLVLRYALSWRQVERKGSARDQAVLHGLCPRYLLDPDYAGYVHRGGSRPRPVSEDVLLRRNPRSLPARGPTRKVRVFIKQDEARDQDSPDAGLKAQLRSTRAACPPRFRTSSA